jgi:CheY-like chemotaxis protein
VLLVEDNQALADTTEALLVAHGAQVTRADDALQALRLIETGAAFDVVLSDVMMPGATDGLALARYLRDLRPALPVILITALGQVVAGEEGEFKVLHKPCPQPELLAAVFQAINESDSSRAAARLRP